MGLRARGHVRYGEWSGVGAGGGVTRWQGGSGRVFVCVSVGGDDGVRCSGEVVGGALCVQWCGLRKGVTAGLQAGTLRCREHGCVYVCVRVLWVLSTVQRRAV